jgi:hypothetical protein
MNPSGPLPGLEAILHGLMQGGKPTGSTATALMPLLRGLSGQFDSMGRPTPFQAGNLTPPTRISGVGQPMGVR